MRTQKSLTMRTREGVCFSCSDHLGSTSLTVNINALVTSQTGYMPWGGVEESTGSSPTDYGYTGQMREGDIYYYGARWPKVPEAKLKGFDPSIGRFMQADTIVPLQVQGTQAFDRYAYVNNNPLRYTDPSGNRACDDYYGSGCAVLQPSSSPLYFGTTIILVGGTDGIGPMNQFPGFHELTLGRIVMFDPDSPPETSGSTFFHPKLAIANEIQRIIQKSIGHTYFVCFSSGVGACSTAYAIMSTTNQDKIFGVAFLDGPFDATVPTVFRKANQDAFPIHSYFETRNGLDYDTVEMSHISTTFESKIGENYLYFSGPKTDATGLDDWGKHLLIAEDVLIMNEILKQWGFK